jgi:hypothetical protein
MQVTHRVGVGLIRIPNRQSLNAHTEQNALMDDPRQGNLVR